MAKSIHRFIYAYANERQKQQKGSPDKPENITFTRKEKITSGGFGEMDLRFVKSNDTTFCVATGKNYYEIHDIQDIIN